MLTLNKERCFSLFLSFFKLSYLCLYIYLNIWPFMMTGFRVWEWGRFKRTWIWFKTLVVDVVSLFSSPLMMFFSFTLISFSFSEERWFENFFDSCNQPTVTHCLHGRDLMRALFCLAFSVSATEKKFFLQFAFYFSSSFRLFYSFYTHFCFLIRSRFLIIIWYGSICIYLYTISFRFMMMTALYANWCYKRPFRTNY